LESIEQQTFQDYEVIIVANGCTDGTKELVSSKENPKLRLISTPIANVSRARNIGAKDARGNLLVFLDADTLLGPHTLTHIHQRINSKHAFATTKSVPDNPKYSSLINLKNVGLWSGVYRAVSGILICHRHQFLSVGGFDESAQVGEHRLLRKKLLGYGKYKFINTPVTTSMRRFEKWGVGKTTVFWGRQMISRLRNKNTSKEYKIR